MASDAFSQSLDRLKESFLWAAAQNGSNADCSSLLEIGADINWKGQDGLTSLEIACRRGHSDTVALLIVHGAEVNVANGADGMSPLHICCRRGDTQTLNILLEADANVNVRNKDGQTGLDIAKNKGYEDICQRLMQHRRTGSNGNSSSSSSSSNRSSTSTLLGRRPGSSSSSGTSAPSQQASVHASLSSSAPVLTSATATATNNVGSPRRPSSSSSSSSSSSTSSSTSSFPSLSLEAAAKLTGERTISSGGGGGGGYKSTPSEHKGSSSSNSNNSNNSAASSYALTSVQSNSYQQQAETPTEIALRRLLESEQRARRTAEEKLDVQTRSLLEYSEQNQQLLLEVATAIEEAGEARTERDDLVEEINRLRGTKEAMAKLHSVEECSFLEKTLKRALEACEGRKEELIKAAMDLQRRLAEAAAAEGGGGGSKDEARMCVVCHEREKSVVLLPCRHMALCVECSSHEQMQHCPLCRRPIAHKISVYN